MPYYPEFLRIHKSGKARVVGLVVSVDRMEKGSGERAALREIREEHGIKTTAIVSFADLVTFLETEEGEGYLARDSALLTRMREYYGKYGAL